MFTAEAFAENSQHAVLETFDEKRMKQTVVKITEKKYDFHKKHYRYKYRFSTVLFWKTTETQKLKAGYDNKRNHNDDDDNNNSMLRIFPTKPFHPHSCCQLYMANVDDPKALRERPPSHSSPLCALAQHAPTLSLDDYVEPLGNCINELSALLRSHAAPDVCFQRQWFKTVGWP